MIGVARRALLPSGRRLAGMRRAPYRLDELTWSRTGLSVRGLATLTHLTDREATVRLLLRDRSTKATVAVPATVGTPSSEGPGLLEAQIDFATADGGAPVPPGVWTST